MQHPPIKREITDLPHALKLFVLVSLGLTLLCYVYTLICRHMGLGLPYSFPYLYIPGLRFQDFIGFLERFRHWGTPRFFDNSEDYFMYPAPLAHVFHFFLNLPLKRVCYLAAMLATAASLALVFVRVLRRQGLAAKPTILFVATTVLLSYPLIFDVETGNIEFLVWLASTIAVWCFFKGRISTSAVFIGLAASLKIYPIIFLGLFLPRRKYTAFFLALAVDVAVTLISLHGLGPTIAAAQRWDSIQIAAFSKYYVGSIVNVGYDHSFFGLVKGLTLHWHPDYFAWARPYTIAGAVISLVLYFGRIWRLPLTNQILALSILSVTLAPASYDYTLLNLYPAFAVLAVLAVQATRRGTHIPVLSTYMVLFALLFTPESYAIIHGHRYAGQMRSICLIVMLVLALVRSLPEADSYNNTQLELDQV